MLAGIYYWLPPPSNVLLHLWAALHTEINCISTPCLEYISEFLSNFMAVTWPCYMMTITFNITTWALTDQVCWGITLFHIPTT